MATIKVKFRPSAVAGGYGTVYYRIIHQRKSRQLLSEYRLLPSEWDENLSTTITARAGERRSYLRSIRENIRRDVERLNRIIRKLDNGGSIYSADDVVEEFDRYAYEYTLFNFMKSVIVRLRQNGRIRTSETYTAALNSFRRFRREEDIMLDCITSEIMEAYEAWHRSRGNSSNTVSFYTRILRAVYNRAVEEEIVENRNPFRRVYTGVDKTVKRAVPLSHIRRIKMLDLSLSLPLDYARDMFLLSFFLRGMSFIDMAFLKKSDMRSGYIVYRRRKTGQQLTIEWTPEMQAILDKYPANPTQYLLPIIKTPGINERCAYRNTGYNINYNLKKVALMAGIDTPLTMYVARHSWASAAKSKGIPLSVISEGMGHDSEATTLIYLASLDSSVIDDANSIIIRSL